MYLSPGIIVHFPLPYRVSSETDAPTAAPTPVASSLDDLVENSNDAVSMRMLSSGGLLFLVPLVGSFAALLGTSVFGGSVKS